MKKPTHRQPFPYQGAYIADKFFYWKMRKALYIICNTLLYVFGSPPQSRTQSPTNSNTQNEKMLLNIKTHTQMTTEIYLILQWQYNFRHLHFYINVPIYFQQKPKLTPSPLCLSPPAVVAKKASSAWRCSLVVNDNVTKNTKGGASLQVTNSEFHQFTVSKVHFTQLYVPPPSLLAFLFCVQNNKFFLAPFYLRP